jgi:hypothetical protein
MWYSGIEYKELIWMTIVIVIGAIYGILASTYGKKGRDENRQ